MSDDDSSGSACPEMEGDNAEEWARATELWLARKWERQDVDLAADDEGDDVCPSGPAPFLQVNESSGGTAVLPRCSANIAIPAVRRLISRSFTPSGDESREFLALEYVGAPSAPLRCAPHVPVHRHGVLEAARLASIRGLPLVLEPRHMWLMVLQGLADVVLLGVSTPDILRAAPVDPVLLVKGDAWDALPPAFTGALRNVLHSPDITRPELGVRASDAAVWHMMCAAPFLNLAPPVDEVRAALETPDAMPGISRLYLAGAPRHWDELAVAVHTACVVFGVRAWHDDALAKPLGFLARAASEPTSANVAFARAAYTPDGGGWLRDAFCPFGLELACGVSRVPFAWEEQGYTESRAMLLCAGFMSTVGVLAHGVTPALGWAIAAAQPRPRGRAPP